MENMQMDTKEVVKEIIEELKESVSLKALPYAEIEGNTAEFETSLGLLTVQVLSEPDDMVSCLEYHQGDIRFLIATIRASTIEYTAYQKELIKELDEEYEKFVNSDVDFNSEKFEDIVTELKEDLIPKEILDPEYCEEQRNFYNCVYHALAKSSFPYSEEEMKLLKEFKENLKWATGNLSAMQDMGMIMELQKFLELMKKHDHKNNGKFYVECTVDFYVQEIIDELYSPALNELCLILPEDFMNEPEARLANYVTEQLKTAYHGVHYTTHTSLFHLGMSEIYTRFLDIFHHSGLLLNMQHKELITGIMKGIGTTVRAPTATNYAHLQLGCYGFLDALRRNHEDRETKTVDGYMVIDEDGPIAKVIAKITRELDDLQEAAEIHHKNFLDYSSSVPEIIKPLFHHFLKIFPKEYKETVTVEWVKKFRAPALHEVWLNRTGRA